MTAAETSAQSLEAQIEMLQSVNVADSAQRVQTGIQRRIGLQRRQVILASLGAGVAAIATLHFMLQGNAIAFWALTPVTALFVFAAWRSARQADSLAALKTGTSLLASWREQLQQQLRHTMIAPLMTLLFGCLTAWVVWRFGLLHYKSVIFLMTATGIFVFAADQFLVVRPSLQRELEMLGRDA